MSEEIFEVKFQQLFHNAIPLHWDTEANNTVRAQGYGIKEKTNAITLYDVPMAFVDDDGSIRDIQGDVVTVTLPGVKRDIKYIALEELAAGLMVLLEQNMTADKEGLYRTLANQLGFSRLGDAIYAKFDEALSLIDNISIADNVITWNG